MESESEDAAPRVVWEGICDLTADSLTMGQQPTESPGQRAEAEAFLKDLLACGPKLSQIVEEEAKRQGIAPRTLKRAKKDLGVRSYQKSREWWMELPTSPEPDQMAQRNNVALWHSGTLAPSEVPADEEEDPFEVRQASDEEGDPLEEDPFDERNW